MLMSSDLILVKILCSKFQKSIALSNFDSKAINNQGFTPTSVLLSNIEHISDEIKQMT